jgi:hypothetical protein
MKSLIDNKYKSFVLILFSSILINACDSTSSTENKFYITSTENLQNSNERIFKNTQYSYFQIEELLREPFTAYHAKAYKTKAKEAMELSQNIYDSLESIKKNETKKGSKIKNNVSKLILNYIKFFNNLELEKYSNVSVNKFFMGDSVKYISFISEINFENKNIKQFSLCKIQNDIRCFENNYVSYCNNNASPGCNLGSITTSLLVGQNTNHLKKGEILEILAGIGQYAQNTTLSATINNEILKQDRIGTVSYKFKVSGKSGKNSIPIILRYKDTRDEEKTDTVIIEYTIDD